MYCPPESGIYVDPAYFIDVANRYGDIVVAYLVAREVGRHVQSTLAGDSMSGPKRTPPMQARLDLQADCYAGVWMHFARKRNLLDPADPENVRKALVSGANVTRDSNPGALRARSFGRGLATGNPRSCDFPALPGAVSGNRR